MNGRGAIEQIDLSVLAVRVLAAAIYSVAAQICSSIVARLTTRLGESKQ